MKRLFFQADDLDDAAEIVYTLEAEGIQDDQFFVLFRDEKALRKRFMHGDKKLEGTRIIAAGQRSTVFGFMGLFLFLFSAIITLPFLELFTTSIALLAMTTFISVKGAVLLAGTMYDDYFRGVFNNKLNRGKAVFVVDTKSGQRGLVKEIFQEYESTELMVDSSTFLSPLPQRKYIRRTLPQQRKTKKPHKKEPIVVNF